MLQNKINILVLFVCTLSLLMSEQVLAQKNLIVEFENTPLFSEVNFVPGDSINRWVKATNNSGESQDIIIEAINVNDINNFSESMNLQILSGSNILFNNTLKEFFNSGEMILGELMDQDLMQYNLLITFLPELGNDYQALSLSFDILIGFLGTDDEVSDGGGGGGGGSVLPGLTILSETVRAVVEQTDVTITWNTSYLSTSQVVYSKEGETYKLDLSADNFGYTYSYPDPEDFNKVTGHSVTIPNLDSNSTYYFRCISHASPPTISREFSFTTTEDSIINVPNQEDIGPVVLIPDTILEPIIKSEITTEDKDDTVDNIVDILEPEEVIASQDIIPNNGMLAAIGNILSYKVLGPILILFIFILIVWIIRWIIMWYIRDRRRKY